MNLVEILKFTEEYLKKYSFSKPRLEAEKLVSYVLNLDRIALYIHYERELSEDEKNSIKHYLKKMVEEKKEVLQFISYTCNYEDIGILMIAAVAQDAPLEQLTRDMDSEIKRLQTELISEKEYEKLLNSFETSFIANNSDVRGIAYSLAVDYTFYKDTNLINKELDLYRKVTREDIRRVAKQYLNANQRLEIDYLPEKKSN